MMTGRLDDAAEAAQQALAYGRAHGERGYEAYALRLLGEVALATAPAEAERYHLQALTLAEELGMRPLVAHCHAGLGGVFQRRGEAGHAQAELTTAVEMYRTMDMTFGLPLGLTSER